ncbi:ead/Ea22-like family protein [Enterobacter cloacae]|uniref:ead/Ea22-like family protein n=1 Tax=Enterobacter cloacae TaxID=550 RepID=UPI002FD62380
MSNIDKRALREAAERAESDSWGYDRDEFNEALTPSTVLALLDELEKMQAQSSKWCEAFHKAVSVGARYEERIAELEALEVKLPELKMLSDYLEEVTMREREDILVGVRLEFFRALEEAGVKVAAAAGKGEAS